MIDKIKDLVAEIEALKASKKEEIEALRIKYLSKKGEISSLFNDFRNVPAEQKKEVGMLLNGLKEKAQLKINELKALFENGAGEKDFVDLTRTPYPVQLGTRHPISIVHSRRARGGRRLARLFGA